jgi:hypothetical protein
LRRASVYSGIRSKLGPKGLSRAGPRAQDLDGDGSLLPLISLLSLQPWESEKTLPVFYGLSFRNFASFILGEFNIVFREGLGGVPTKSKCIEPCWKPEIKT